MKINTIHVISALIIGLILSSFSYKFLAGETSITLADALKNKLITASFTSTGSYSGSSVNADMKNISQKSIRILIPASTLFDATPEDEQDMVIPQDIYVQLSPGQVKRTVLDGFCSNASGRVPKENSAFRVSKITKKGFPELIAFSKGKKIEPHIMQDAVWTLTNGYSAANIYSENTRDTVVRDLRSMLFKVTGQKETWYNSPQVRTVSPDRNINSETVQIKGDLKFNGTKGKMVNQEIWSSTKQLFKMDGYVLKNTGEISMEFNVKVKGWEKGKYEVRVFEGDKLIKSFEFVV